MTGPIAALSGVSVVYDGVVVLADVDWQIARGQRWVVLGRNGSGKTTLVRVLSLYQHPSVGTVDVLGGRWGETDIRSLRAKVGVTSAALRERLRPSITAHDVVVTARYAALEPWWHRYTAEDSVQAARCLGRMGCGALAERAFGTLSSGEQQRVLLARTLMAEPQLLLLDEPTAGLDLTGREELVATLADLATDPATPPTVLVTHHVDEIPPGFTHALLLRAGRVVASGPLDDVITAETLSDCFGIPLALERRDGRWSATKR